MKIAVGSTNPVKIGVLIHFIGMV